jgi:hypothetical protein
MACETYYSLRIFFYFGEGETDTWQDQLDSQLTQEILSR